MKVFFKSVLFSLVRIYLVLPKLLVKLMPSTIGMKLFNYLYDIMPFRSKIRMKNAQGNDDFFTIEVFNYDTQYRVDTFYSKEPLTIEWLDKMAQKSVFWDIGANVGIYSLYAAKKNLSVVAFEPSYANYYALNRNINLNKCDQRIKAFCTALASDNHFGTFNMGDISLGGAFYTYSNEDLNSFYYPGMGSSKVVFRQGSLAMQIDKAISEFNLEVPNYIKIDVDGIEKAIISGSLSLLKNEKLKEILIEVNNNDDYEIIFNWMTISGFMLKAKEQCDGDIYNYLFVRN